MPYFSDLGKIFGYERWCHSLHGLTGKTLRRPPRTSQATVIFIYCFCRYFKHSCSTHYSNYSNYSSQLNNISWKHHTYSLQFIAQYSVEKHYKTRSHSIFFRETNMILFFLSIISKAAVTLTEKILLFLKNCDCNCDHFSVKSRFHWFK